MIQLRRYLCKIICGPHDHSATSSPLEPFEIREASHNASNAAMAMQASAKEVKGRVNAFVEFAKALEHSGNEL